MNRSRLRSLSAPSYIPPQGPADVPYRLGLTGSIGMGKTTIGGMFRDLKVPVLDSDASVHELYAQGGAAVPLVQELFPSAVVDGARANFCSCLCRCGRCACELLLVSVQTHHCCACSVGAWRSVAALREYKFLCQIYSVL